MRFEIWLSPDGSEESMFSPEGKAPETVRLLTMTNDWVPVEMRLVLVFESDLRSASKYYRRWRGGRFASKR